MIDCGFGIRSTLERLERYQCGPEEITAILVTHEHGDHINGVASLARRFNIPVFATKGTARTGKLDKAPLVNTIIHDQVFCVGNIDVLPVPVPHDAIEPCQFVFHANNKKLGIMTDLGSISSHVMSMYQDCDGLLLEANHDLDMLWSGQYPASLKQRVSSDWGHLSNCQAERFLEEAGLNNLKTLVLAHLSEQNNCINIVKQQFSRFEDRLERLVYASQSDGFDWLELG